MWGSGNEARIGVGVPYAEAAAGAGGVQGGGGRVPTEGGRVHDVGGQGAYTSLNRLMRGPTLTACVACVQVLVTGSLYLVGDMLQLLHMAPK